jgi:hypothetical protein
MTRPPHWFEWLTVVAILLGPVLALAAQRVLDRMREKRQNRLRLFMALMSTRAAQLSPAHVQALNSIDVVFNTESKEDRDIRAAWRNVLQHMNVGTELPPADWPDRLNDLKADLYLVMGKAVGYTYTIDYLKRAIYSPRGYTDAEQDQIALRQALTKAVTQEGVKVKIVS